MPSPEFIREHKSLQILGDWIHDPNLFHLNLHSVSVAFFVGVFVAFLPIPMQMAVAAVLAVWIRCNLPLAVALVWITNPVTMPVIYYAAYKVGVMIMGREEQAFEFELSWEWLSTGFLNIWEPMLVGSLACGLFFGLLSSSAIRIYWRWHVGKRWRRRKWERARRKQ